MDTKVQPTDTAAVKELKLFLADYKFSLFVRQVRR